MHSKSGITNIEADPAFKTELESRGVRNLTKCMQCMRCGVGCPVAHAMDFTPTQIIRMAILGMKEEIFASKTIHLCSACNTCTTRCPMEIDVARTMDTMKEMSVESGFEPAERNSVKFNDIFMNVVRARGRVNEPLLFGHYKMKTGTYFDDMEIGMDMIKKRKIKFSPKAAGRDEVRKIIDRFRHKI